LTKLKLLYNELGKQPPARDIRFPRGDFMMKLNRTLQSLFFAFRRLLAADFLCRFNHNRRAMAKTNNRNQSEFARAVGRQRKNSMGERQQRNFLRTIDGGKTWTVGVVPDAGKLDFRDVEAFDANTAYLLSIGEGENSRIYKTNDGGETWKLQFKNTNPKAFFDALAFWDKTHGIAMSDPVDGKYLLIETKDGEIWNVIDNKQSPRAKEGEAAFAASGTCLITQGKSNVYLVSGGRTREFFILAHAELPGFL
jgi:photosystem II stability/assembly factor-like uncharacterized protein